MFERILKNEKNKKTRKAKHRERKMFRITEKETFKI
jgi:hypothetical protein